MAARCTHPVDRRRRVIFEAAAQRGLQAQRPVDAEAAGAASSRWSLELKGLSSARRCSSAREGERHALLSVALGICSIVVGGP